MAEKSIPYCWIGQKVAVGLIPAYGSPLENPRHTWPVGTTVQAGVLHDVNELGIVASLHLGTPSDDVEEPLAIFYPWSAILAILPGQKGNGGGNGHRSRQVAPVAPIQ